MLARGCTRTTFLLGRWALKFPTLRAYDGRWWRNFLYGLLGNMHEWEWSKVGNPHLCPILFSLPGGFLNIMPRVQAFDFSGFSWDDYTAFVERGDCRLPVEYKPDSFGLLNGRLVAVDYGS